ncbi:MAG: hypothetical protein RLZZ524_2475, partial [Pseudomonadota bacterium]
MATGKSIEIRIATQGAQQAA